MKKSLLILTISLLLVEMVALAQTTRQVQKMDNAKIGGSTALETSAVLEVESTTAGVLLSRMSTAQRDAITAPANAMLIFNTTNNTFEVYKSTCSCWVGLNDGGGNSPIQNTSPIAYNLVYSGNFYAGQTVTLNYVYGDAQNDPESGSTIQWQQSADQWGSTGVANIQGANSASYIIPLNVGATTWIRAVVTPRSSTGVKNGILTTTGVFFKVDPLTSPTALSVAVSGVPEQGSQLNGNYTFSGGSGIESSNSALPTVFIWESAADNIGTNISTVSTYGAPGFSTIYVPQSDLIQRFIRFGVRPRDNAGIQASNFVYSPWVGPIALAIEQPPVASNVNYTPSPANGNILSASYFYTDPNGDPEGLSVFKWYRADNATGLNEQVISGATSLTYTATNADEGKYLGFGVTPVALSGSTTGNEVKFYNANAVLPKAIFTFTAAPISYSPLFNQGRSMNVDNDITVEINVSQTGGARFTTNEVNGYSFSLSTILSQTGVQKVTLKASGTQTNFNSTTDNFTIDGMGVSTVNKAFAIKNTLTGSGVTSAHGVATTAFNTNTTCSSNLISTGYDSASCNGNVTVGANVYGLTLINGQCWMTRNIDEVPTAPCTDPINSGCNVYTGTVPASAATWGYYNVAVPNGVSGWATVSPAPGSEGLMYQWSAAMNGATQERAKGVCPQGFHIPSDCEFKYLEHGLGMTVTDQNLATNTRASGQVGAKLNHTSTNTLATNSTGFSMLRSGRRHVGQFQNRLQSEQIWTSTIDPTQTPAAFRRVNSNSNAVGTGDALGRGADVRVMAMFVRCIKD